jgi:hypothetical protein
MDTAVKVVKKGIPSQKKVPVYKRRGRLASDSDIRAPNLVTKITVNLLTYLLMYPIDVRRSPRGSSDQRSNGDDAAAGKAAAAERRRSLLLRR